MKPTLRAIVWETTERLLDQLHITPGTAFPIAMMVEVKKEEAVPAVRSELQRLGIEVAAVDKTWWPFGRRWQMAAKAPPQPVSRTEIDHWLDRLETVLAPHDADVVTWVPQVPGA
jgi:hypothetical protein